MPGKTLQCRYLLLLATGVGALCFLAGRWSVRGENESAKEVETGRKGFHAAERDRMTDGPPPRRRSTPSAGGGDTATTADAGQDVPKMEIPRRVVRDMVNKELASGGFQSLEDIPRTTGKALDLLDVTAEEREAVVAAVTKMRDEVKETERKTAIFKEATESSVVLDMSGMRGQMEGIRARMDLEIGSALKRDKANLLIDGYPWDLIYPEKEMVEVAFSVERTQERRTLMATRRYSGNRESVGIRRWNDFKDDGKPLRAEGVFEGRWAHLVEGRMLLPVDME